MNLNYNALKIIIESLPLRRPGGYRLDTPERIDWLYALVKPLRWLDAQFRTFRDKTDYDLSRNGRTMVLEDLLNNELDPVDRQIYIVDNTQLPYTQLYLVAENQPPTAAFLRSEIPTGTYLVAYEIADYGQYEFTVWLPGSVINDPILYPKAQALVAKYKVAGPRPNFQEI